MTSAMNLDELIEGVLAGEDRALARAMSTIENRTGQHRELIEGLYPHRGEARVIGVTGSPGVGKSTLVDRLATAYAADGLSVGVLAIDPQSPFSGGSILGDRVRFDRSSGEPDVFVRSVSTRGAPGGIATATSELTVVLEAAGMDRILIETVGAGQSEIDVVRVADSVAVVLQPETGDDVQMLKAGILETADVLVVNKADLPGVDQTITRLQEMLEIARHTPSEAAWEPPIVRTVAERDEGIDGLRDALHQHHEYLAEDSRLEERRRRRHRADLRRLAIASFERQLDREFNRPGGLVERIECVESGEQSPYHLVDELLANWIPESDD